MRGEFIELDFAKFSNVADLLTLEGCEVGGYTRRGQVHNTGEGFVEQGTD